MSFDLMPKKFLTVPKFIPDIWEEDDWLMPSINQNGLSVSEDDKNIYVEASVPGIDPENVEMTFQDGYLWVKGENTEEEEDKKKKFYRKALKSFSYRVLIPGDIDISKEPEATCKNGIIKIVFTKSPKAQPKKIQLKIKK